MVAVIIGDIINSRIDITGKWRIELKQTLNQFGSEPVSQEIFRRDSFQLELEPMKALKASIQIKSAIKQIKGIDVSMGIGVGEK